MKVCPKCGSRNVRIIDMEESFIVICDDCEFTPNHGGLTVADAIEIWNNTICEDRIINAKNKISAGKLANKRRKLDGN